MSLRSSPTMSGLSTSLVSSPAQHHMVSIHHLPDDRLILSPTIAPSTPYPRKPTTRRAAHSFPPSTPSFVFRFLFIFLTSTAVFLVVAFALFGIFTLLTSPLSLFSPPSPPLTFTNFTINPHLQSRWPVPYPANTQRTPAEELHHATSDPFTRYSVGRYLSTRGAVISLFTSNQREWFSLHFDANVNNFFQPMQDHSDWIIFYPIYPINVEKELHDLILSQANMTLISPTSPSQPPHPSSDLHGRLRALSYPWQVAAVKEYLHSSTQVHVITVPVIINLPRYLQQDAGLLLRDDWMYCWGMRWDLDYSLYSGAVFPTQLFTHDILLGYDYFLKLDLDVRITQPLPSTFHRMASQSCVYLHAEYRDRVEDCGFQAPEAVVAWAGGRGGKVASNDTKWFWSTDYYWGNFMGGWLGWMRSVENRALSEFLYEDKENSGYFKRRWGDQPSAVKMLGMWYQLGEEEVRGVSEGTGMVCDMTKVRKEGTIVHKWTVERPYSDF